MIIIPPQWLLSLLTPTIINVFYNVPVDTALFIISIMEDCDKKNLKPL